MCNQPSLFGLDNSNRDFTKKDSWGKNQFNSAFPAALCCFLYSKGERANYLNINEKGFFSCDHIEIDTAFNSNPLNSNTYYAFEAQYSPYQQYVIGSLPRTDLVIQKANTGQCLAGLEIKLTTLPDNTTCELSDENYGSEIVVRPDTIVYLACSIIKAMGKEHPIFNSFPDAKINDWTEPKEVVKGIDSILEKLAAVATKMHDLQTPFLLQPIWKTNGKSPQLAFNCLDVFLWSDAAFTYFITEIAEKNSAIKNITRGTRTAIWLYKMLLDMKEIGKFDYKNIIDTMSFNTKNDKAFACSGNITNQYMQCDRLKNPKITTDQIKEIILGGGQNLLSPERRFDAIIYNSPELFDE